MVLLPLDSSGVLSRTAVLREAGQYASLAMRTFVLAVTFLINGGNMAAVFKDHP